MGLGKYTPELYILCFWTSEIHFGPVLRQACVWLGGPDPRCDPHLCPKGLAPHHEAHWQRPADPSSGRAHRPPAATAAPRNPRPAVFSTDCALGSTNCFLYMASWQKNCLPAASSPPWRSPSCGALQKGGFFTFLLLLNPKATKAGVSRTELDPAKNPCS